MRSFKRGSSRPKSKRKRESALDSKFGPDAWPFKPDEKDYDDGTGKAKRPKLEDKGRWDGKATHES